MWHKVLRSLYLPLRWGEAAARHEVGGAGLREKCGGCSGLVSNKRVWGGCAACGAQDRVLCVPPGPKGFSPGWVIPACPLLLPCWKAVLHRGQGRPGWGGTAVWKEEIIFSACSWLQKELMVSLKLPLAGSKQNFSLGPLGCDKLGEKQPQKRQAAK